MALTYEPRRAWLSLGSNLGDRIGYLQQGIETLRWAGARITEVSSVYETAPVGVLDQPNFLNAVVVVLWTGDPYDLLAAAHEAEQQADRVREQRWGPRTLDVDIIAIDGVELDDERLTLPHPEAHRRAFVLVPLIEVSPDAVLGTYGTATELLAELADDDKRSVRRTSLELRTS